MLRGRPGYTLVSLAVKNTKVQATLCSRGKIRASEHTHTSPGCYGGPDTPNPISSSLPTYGV